MPAGPPPAGPAEGGPAPATPAGAAPPAGDEGPPPPRPPGSGGPVGPAPTDPQDRSRAGAVWVTGTGAFLLVAAAAVFVAVQWDHLSNEVKLGILASVTGTCLLAGRRLRAVLPATSGVLYHLGAFLIPANTAAIALHLDLDWPPFLLLEGATATAAWTVLNRVERSVVLRWATAAAVVVTAAGVGAVTHTPTPLLLAGCAAVAEGLRRHKEATGWALVAGLAPAIALAAPTVPTAARVLIEGLGLAGPGPQLSAAVTGLVAAAVLGRNAQRRQDLVLVATAAVALLLGVTTAWVGAQPPAQASLIGLAAVFLFLEIAAHLVRRDAFWGRPGQVVGVAVEAIAVAATPFAFGAGGWALATGRLAPFGGAAPTGPVVWSSLVAGGLAAAAWFVADLRRREADGLSAGYALLLGGGFGPTAVFAPVALLAGLACATASIPIVTTVALVLAALLVLSGRPFGQATATCLVLTAVALQGLHVATAAFDRSSSVLLVAAAVGGAAVLAAIAVIRSRMTGEEHAPLAWASAVAAAVVLEMGWASLPGDPFLRLLGLAAAGAALAFALDRLAATDVVGNLGWVGRAVALLTFAQGAALPAEQLAVLGAAVTGLVLFDALVRRAPSVLFALSISVPVTVTAWAFALHMSSGTVGLALCVVAAAAAGLQLLLPRTWSDPALSVVLACAATGFALSTSSLGDAGTAAIILGAIGFGYSAVGRSTQGAIASGVVVTLGVWAHLAAGNVTALDAYLAPVAIGLLAAGWQARAQRARPNDGADAGPALRIPTVSSWVAYGPGIIMLGGSALLERTQGGAGIHGLVAGAVGVLAVLAGGGRRLMAPLFLGTALLLGLTLNESLAVTREVPTWGWLALGGTVLLGAGIAMERLQTGPVESGRRLVDVISERFS